MSPIAAAALAVTLVISQRTLQQPVEQQTPGGATQPDRSLWVTNPTGCLWDTDDWLEARLSGKWAKGETRTYTDCVVADNDRHVARLELSAGLTGSITIDGVNVGLCGATPWYGDPEYLALPEVEGSNGGHGRIVQVTWTVTNPGHTRKGTAFLRIRPDFPAWRCP